MCVVYTISSTFPHENYTSSISVAMEAWEAATVKHLLGRTLGRDFWRPGGVHRHLGRLWSNSPFFNGKISPLSMGKYLYRLMGL